MKQKQIGFICALSIILATGMIFVPKKASAFTGVGQGNNTYPYRITTCDELDEIRDRASAKYVLMNDIDCSATSTWNAGAGFDPLSFSGTFDGRNHTISGIFINRPTTQNVGLFGFLNGTVKNLKLVDTDITGQDYVGSLVGLTDGGAALSYVSASGTVEGVSVTGGLVGRLSTNTHLSSASFTGSVTTSSGTTGGLVGSVYNSVVTDSYANATVTTSGLWAGAFAGKLESDTGSESSIARSYAIGQVTGDSTGGGFVSTVAKLSSGNVFINNSFVMVHGQTGETGQVPAINASQGVATTSNFYYSGDDAKTNTCGDLDCTSFNDDGSDANHYKNTTSATPLNNWNFTTVWQTATGQLPSLRDDTNLDTLATVSIPAAPTDLVAAQQGGHTVYLSWSTGDEGGSTVSSFNVRWKVTSSNTWTTIDPSPTGTEMLINDLPLDTSLTFEVKAVNAVGVSTSGVSTTFTLPPATPISTCQELQAMSDEAMGVYYLTQDIDCSSTNPANENFDELTWDEGGFNPIPNFSGELDGAGYSVSDLFINRENWGNAPIKDLNQGGSIHDISFTNEDITSYGEGAGAVAYPNNGSTIDNVNVQGTIRSSYTAGGIAAYTEASNTLTISNSTADVEFETSFGNEDGYDWGGVIGYAYISDGEFNIDTNTTTVSTNAPDTNHIGGLIGFLDFYDHSTVNVTDSTSSGEITAYESIGGLIGYEYTSDTTILNINNSSSDTSIVSSQYTGGLIGYLDGDASDTNIYQSNFSGQIHVGEVGDGYFGGLVGYNDQYSAMLDIDQSYSEADIQGNGEDLGGLIGYTANPTTISDSYFNGLAVIYGIKAGGLVGSNDSDLTITNSYATGEFVGAAGGGAGGLVGVLNGDTTLSNSFAAVNVGVMEGPFGAIVGVGSELLSEDSNVYFDQSIADIPFCYGDDTENNMYCTPVNIEDEDPNYFFTNSSNAPFSIEETPVWDFTDTWATKSGHYPQLRWALPPPVDPEISSCADLDKIYTHLEDSFVLTQDIDCDGVARSPIGNPDEPFIGELDGNGHSISNLYVGTGVFDYAGLFGAIDSGNVHDLTLYGEVDADGGYVGALAGQVTGNATITNVHSHVDVIASGDNVGGLVGELNAAGPFDHNYAVGNVVGSGNVGGLYGAIYGSSLSDSYAGGAVDGTDDNVGGLIGRSSSNTIERVYATGDATADMANRGGGLIGLSEGDTINDAYARGDAQAIYYVGGLIGAMNDTDISRTYSTGSTTGILALGGLVGYNINTSSITDSFTLSSPTTADADVLTRDGFVGIDFDNEITYTNDWYPTDEGYGCALMDDDGVNVPIPVNLGCAGIQISGEFGYGQDHFYSSESSPLANWSFGGAEGPWHENADDFPNLNPLDEPYYLCEEASVTSTTAHSACDIYPFGWGAETWQARYKKASSNTYTNVTLDDPTQCEFDVTGLQPGTDYYLECRVTNDFGTLPWARVEARTLGDADRDGISDSQENAAPNHGDANGDGTADKNQSNVTSYENPTTNKYVVLEVNEASGCEIQSVGSEGESSSNKDSGFDYPLGLMNFELSCADPGATAEVTQYYYEVISDDFVARKFNPNTNAYTTITGGHVSLASIGGKSVVKLTYEITDGGDLDTDGSVNSTIIDPSGLGSAAVNAPNTGLLKF